MAKAKENKESDILKTLNAKYGKGSVILGNNIDESLEVIDSGSLLLNRALGVGGYPLGVLIEFFGPESSGKSTMTIHAMANFQKAGKKVALIDAEQSFARQYATDLGVDMDELLIVQPKSQEEAYNMMIDMAESKEISLIVVDSQSALIPQKMIDGEIGDATMALQARNNSAGLMKLHRLLRTNKCTVIMISQVRSNIGGYGPMNIPTGGNALKFYADIRISYSKQLEKDDSTNRTTAEVTKNKCAVPFGKAIFAIIWGKGVDRLQEVVDLSVEAKLITRGGAGWYTIPAESIIAGKSGETHDVHGEVKLQGDSKIKEFLMDNEDYLAELEIKVNGK